LAPLQSTLADDPDMAELIAAFVEGLGERIRALREAWSGEDRDLLGRLAHQLKGSAGGYGFPTLGSTAADLEQALRQGMAPGEVGDRVHALVEICQRAAAACAGIAA